MSMWTKDSLLELIQTRLQDHPLIVVANREPYLHRFVSGRIDCVPPVSGMVSALGPILRACGGTWIAHGSGSAGRTTAARPGHGGGPPGKPRSPVARCGCRQHPQ